VIASSSARAGVVRVVLLLAGVAAAALYVAIVDVAAELTPGYSHVAQPVSSLYQSGAPIGLPVAAAFAVYNVLVAAFGLGIVAVARDSAIRIRWGVAAGVALVLLGVSGAVDDVFPQDPIGTSITTTGTLHIAFAGIASLLTVVAMALAARWQLGRHEHRALAWYSAASVLVILVAGPVTAAATASSSPVMGLLERVTILTFMVWMALSSVVLTRAARSEPA
jgi:hypothetical protein